MGDGLRHCYTRITSGISGYFYGNGSRSTILGGIPWKTYMAIEIVDLHMKNGGVQ